MTKQQKIHKIVRDIRWDSNTVDGELYMDKTIDAIFKDMKTLIGKSSLQQYHKNMMTLQIRELEKEWSE